MGKILSRMWLPSMKETDNGMYRKRRGRDEKETEIRKTGLVTKSPLPQM